MSEVSRKSIAFILGLDEDTIIKLAESQGMPSLTALEELLEERDTLNKDHDAQEEEFAKRLKSLTEEIEDLCEHTYPHSKYLYDDHNGWDKPAIITSTYERICSVCGKVERYCRTSNY